MGYASAYGPLSRTSPFPSQLICIEADPADFLSREPGLFREGTLLTEESRERLTSGRISYRIQGPCARHVSCIVAACGPSRACGGSEEALYSHPPSSPNLLLGE